MKFANLFDHSMHRFLLRCCLAENGIDPDTDTRLRTIAPPHGVANLRAANIDGFIAAELFNQRAVFDGMGFIHLLTNELWDNPPCCAFAATRRFVEANPNTFAALFRAIVTATLHCLKMEGCPAVAAAVARPNHLNQPLTALEQVLLRRFANNLGNVRNGPDRINFDPFAWRFMAVWMCTQMG